MNQDFVEYWHSVFQKVIRIKVISVKECYKAGINVPMSVCLCVGEGAMLLNRVRSLTQPLRVSAVTWLPGSLAFQLLIQNGAKRQACVSIKVALRAAGALPGPDLVSFLCRKMRDCLGASTSTMRPGTG